MDVGLGLAFFLPSSIGYFLDHEILIGLLMGRKINRFFFASLSSGVNYWQTYGLVRPARVASRRHRYMSELLIWTDEQLKVPRVYCKITLFVL